MGEIFSVFGTCACGRHENCNIEVWLKSLLLLLVLLIFFQLPRMSHNIPSRAAQNELSTIFKSTVTVNASSTMLQVEDYQW